MIKRIAALALILLLCVQGALGEAWQLTLQAQESDLMSAGALRALNAILADASLQVSLEDDHAAAALISGNDTLLQVQTHRNNMVVQSGASAVTLPLEYIATEHLPAAMRKAAQDMGALLAAWEKESASTVDLQEAGKPKRQTAYVLTEEEWAGVWPQVCDILLPVLADTIRDSDAFLKAGAMLRNAVITGKGTFRRYFAADGTEMGAYFYAAAMRIGENDVREVRLEYGQTPGKGFYLAFRCPNKKETRNVRMTVRCKESVRNERTTYTLTADVRRTYDGAGDTLKLDATLRREQETLSGSVNADVTQKRNGITAKTNVTIEPAFTTGAQGLAGDAAFSFTQDGQLMLKGKVSLSPDAWTYQEAFAKTADMETLRATLAVRLLQCMQQAEAGDRQELLHYLAQDNYLVGETTAMTIESTGREANEP